MRSLVSVTLPDSLTGIESNAFAGCASLTSINLPAGLKRIGLFAFQDCAALTRLDIPDGVETVEYSAFRGCPAVRYANWQSSGAKALGRYGYTFRDPSMPFDLQYVYDGDVVTGLKVTGSDADIVEAAVPEGVTDIGKNAFNGRAGLTAVTLPATLTAIGESAFSGCSGLHEIDLPAGLTTIGRYAFSGCSGLMALSLPEGLTTLSECAFSGCSGLTSLRLPASLTGIDYHAFNSCSALTRVDIPDGLTSLGYGAFDNCPDIALYAHWQSSGARALGTRNYAFMDPDLGFTLCYGEDGLTLMSVDQTEGVLALPDGITAIGANAFKDCAGLTAIELPDSLTAIGGYAFSGCSGLTAIDLPAGLTDIGEYAFSGCKGITAVTVPGGVSSFGTGAFSGCTALAEVTLEEGVRGIAERAFYNCGSLASVALPDSLVSIRDYAFYNCTALPRLELPDGITSYGFSVFRNTPGEIYAHVGSATAKTIGRFSVCFREPGSKFILRYTNYDYSSGVPADLELTGLTENAEVIEVPDGVTTIGSSGAFSGRSTLKRVILPESVTAIGSSAFSGCSALADVSLSEGLTKIGDFAFHGCSSLAHLDLPESLITIGSHAFEGCRALTDLTVPDGVTSVGTFAFTNGPALPYANLGSSAAIALGAADYSFRLPGKDGVWYRYGKTDAHSLELVDANPGITSLDVPEGVVSLGVNALENCTALASLTLPGSLQAIGNNALKGCAALTELTLPDGLVYIGNSALEGCTGLSTLTLPDNVTTIGTGALPGQVTIFCNLGSATAKTLQSYGWTQIRSSNYPDFTFEVLGTDTDYPYLSIKGYLGCEDEVFIPGVIDGLHVYSIGSAAFKDRTDLTRVTLESGSFSIQDSAFSGCANLVAVDGDAGINLVGDRAFYGCSSLERVNPARASRVGTEAFRGCASLAEIRLDYAASIGQSAFRDCASLTRVDASRANGLAAIGDGTFANCGRLELISFDTGVQSVSATALDGCDSLIAVGCTLGSRTVEAFQDIGWNRFIAPSAKGFICSAENAETYARVITVEKYIGGAGSVAIPSRIEQYPIVAIADGAFANREDLTQVTFPDGLTAIGEGAFSGCAGLTALTLPDGLTAISKNAFAGCAGVTALTFPDGLTAIGEGAFAGCTGLQALTFPDGLTAIGSGAFAGCDGLARINLPASLTDIAGDAGWLASVRCVDPDDAAAIPEAMASNAPEAVYVVHYGSNAAASVIAQGLKARYLPFTPDEIRVDDVTLTLGDRRALDVRLIPDIALEDYLEPQLLFSSSDEGVVTVDAGGRLRAVGGGTATVYVEDRLDGFVNAAVKVTVQDPTGRRLTAFASGSASGSGSSGTMTMNYGARYGTGPYTFVLTKRKGTTVLSRETFTVEPDADGSVALSATMSVPDDSSQTTTSYALGFDVSDAAGSTSWGSVMGMWTIKEYVNNRPLYAFRIIDTANPSENQLTSLSLGDRPVVLTVGDRRAMPCTARPSTATPKLIWLSSDYSVVDVEADGTITGVATGTATITACAADGTGLRASCEVRCLERPVTGIEIVTGALDEQTQRQPLTAQVLPEDASEPTLRWTTSDPAIATVDEHGVVSWHDRGDVTITAEATDGTGVSSSVALHWQGIMAQAIALELDPDDPLQLRWTFTPENTTCKEVQFKVNNIRALEIDAEGHMTFLMEATCTVRVLALDGSGVHAELVVSGAPVHDHEFAFASEVRPAWNGEDGLRPRRYCVTCGEELLPGAVISADRCLDLPSGLTAVEAEAFAGLAQVQQIWIPDGVQSIGERAFAGCAGLLLVRIPQSVEEIADDAFQGCEGLLLLCPEDSEAARFAGTHDLQCAAE